MLCITSDFDGPAAVDVSKYPSKKPMDGNKKNVVYLPAVNENLRPLSRPRNKHCTR